MAIDIICSCGKRYAVLDEHAGKVMRCRVCQTKIRIPKANFSDQEIIPSSDATIPSASSPPAAASTQKSALWGCGGYILALLVWICIVVVSYGYLAETYPPFPRHNGSGSGSRLLFIAWALTVAGGFRKIDSWFEKRKKSK